MVLWYALSLIRGWKINHRAPGHLNMISTKLDEEIKLFASELELCEAGQPVAMASSWVTLTMFIYEWCIVKDQFPVACMLLTAEELGRRTIHFQKYTITLLFLRLSMPITSLTLAIFNLRAVPLRSSLLVRINRSVDSGTFKYVLLEWRPGQW